MLLGTGSPSRAQEERTASLGPEGSSLVATKSGASCFRGYSAQERKDCFSVFPHSQAHTKKKKKQPKEEPKQLDYHVLSIIFIFLLFILRDFLKQKQQKKVFICKFAMQVINLKPSEKPLGSVSPHLSQPNTFQLRMQFDTQELSLGFMCTKLILLMVHVGQYVTSCVN